MTLRLDYIIFSLLLFIASILPVLLLDMPYLVGVVSLAIPSILLVLFKERLWVIGSILLFPLYVLTDAEGFSALDAGLAVYLVVGLLLWLSSRLFDKNYHLIQDKTDFLFIFFFISMIALSFLSVISGNKVTTIFSETSRALMILFYFPIRDHFDTKKRLKQFLGLLGVILIIVFLVRFYQNYLKLQNFESVWELGHFTRSNQGIYASTLMFSSLFFLNKQTFRNKIFVLTLTITSALSLVITVSRIYWIATIIGLGLAFYFLDGKKKSILLLSITLVISSFVISILTLFPNIAEAIIDVFAKRFTSVGKFSSDSSFQARIDEYEVAISYIKQYPLGGAGIARNINYYNFLTLDNWVTHFIHNGYIHQSYQLGIPMMLIYMTLIIRSLVSSLVIVVKTKDSFFKTIALGCFTTFLLFLIVNTLTSTFAMRNEPFMLAFAIAFVKIIQNIEKHEQ